MEYWLIHFTGTTWVEFQAAGSIVAGFRENKRVTIPKIQIGDTLLCYMVGVKRFVGLLEVTGAAYNDDKHIWQEEHFPIRLPVSPLAILDPEIGVPFSEIRDKLSYYDKDAPVGRWARWLRQSPTKHERADGKVIAEAINAADSNPVHREVKASLLRRKTKSRYQK